MFDDRNGGNIQDKSIRNVRSKSEGKTTKSLARLVILEAATSEAQDLSGGENNNARYEKSKR